MPKTPNTGSSATSQLAMKRSSLSIPPGVDLEQPISEKRWYDIIRLIHHHTLEFKKLLRQHDGYDINVQYLAAWSSFYEDVCIHRENLPDATWQEITSTHIKKDISIYKEFVLYILEMVPPVWVIVNVRSTRNETYISVLDKWKTDEGDKEQLEAHKSWVDEYENERDEEYARLLQ